jgi:cytochrome c oxidase cbb3-type subunit I/II
MWTAGIMQGLMWRAIDDTGRLQYGDFVETVTRLHPMYLVRALGGGMYVTGMLLFGYNLYRTWKSRPATYAEPVQEAPALSTVTEAEPQPARPPGEGAVMAFLRARWHRRWERLPVTFSVMAALAVIVASLFEILPTFLIRSNVPTIASVQPYQPLELYGRDVYLREGCYNCHSQMVRPFIDETVRYGEYSKPGEFVYDHPFQWGSRRIGPDLHREGGKRNHVWHVHHFRDPRAIARGSVMPAYPHLLADDTPYDVIQARVDAMVTLGVPYADDARRDAEALARAQAARIGAEIVAQGGPPGLADKEVVAIIAYLQRLGTDIKLAPATAPGAPGSPVAASGGR